MSKPIIDVSQYQGAIDWNITKNYIGGAIIRLGFGKNLAKQDDLQALRNINACILHKIPFGVYLYSYAKDMQSAKSEAEHALRMLESYKPDLLALPVYYDLEEAGTEHAAVDNASLFCNIIEHAGYQAGIYANEYWFKTVIKDDLDMYPKWVAKYANSKPVIPGKPGELWQYTSRGSIPGIVGHVDLNQWLQKEASTETDYPFTLLKKGDKNEMVAILQQHLKGIGYYNDKVDGSFGGNTQAAVDKWKKQSGAKWLPEDWRVLAR